MIQRLWLRILVAVFIWIALLVIMWAVGLLR
jgi:hypothetical protein